MDNRKIHLILDHVLALETFKGEENRPYVSLEISNYGITVRIKDNGINSDCVDGEYKIDLEHKQQRTINNCIDHLVDLYRIMEAKSEEE